MNCYPPHSQHQNKIPDQINVHGPLDWAFLQRPCGRPPDVLHRAATTSGSLPRPLLDGHDGMFSGDVGKADSSSLERWRTMCSHEDEAFFCPLLCEASDEDCKWEGLESKVHLILEELRRSRQPNVEQQGHWEEWNHHYLSMLKDSNQGYLRSSSLTSVPIKVMGRFTYNPTDRPLQ